jgi:hypothetical protein
MPYIDADTGEEVALSGRGGSKYNSRWTFSELWQLSFQSKREANRADELWAMVKAGEITGLLFQARFLLQPGFEDMRGKKIRPIHLIGDFQYQCNGRTIVEDTKGMRTEVFNIKAKLFKYRYPNVELRLV